MTRSSQFLDLILVGGGLANGLLAYRLRQTRPDLHLLVLERDPVPGGVHTWSFHETDLTAEQNRWIDPFVAHRWPGYEVRFPGFARRLGVPYRTITADRFRAVLAAALGADLIGGVEVQSVAPTEIRLASGETLTARAVIDGRGFCPVADRIDRFQCFIGQEVQLTRPHGLVQPILMDATVEQVGGYRFVYVLPFAPDVLLIEDTYYADAAGLDPPLLRGRIAAYAKAMGWEIAAMLREEHGVLPITLSGRHQARPGAIAAVGMRAGLFHPTTGYALPDAVRLADRIAASDDLSPQHLAAITARLTARQWRRGRMFRLLNRLLFLAGEPEQRYRIMQRFYAMPETLIARFYADDLKPGDKIRLLIGRPPVPFSGALRAIMATGR